MASVEVTEPHKLTQGKKPYKISLGQDHNRVEFVTFEVQDDDIVANSIQKIVNEILEDIGDILISEKLFEFECEMVLAALAEQIKKSQDKNRGQNV